MHKRMSPHGDLDHMGSSYELINKINVKEVYFNNNELNDNEKELIKKLIKKKIKYQKIGNYSYSINSFKIKIRSYNLNSENDSSMMISIVHKNIKILLMGDATITSEKYLLNEYKLGKYNVLKLGHHGSKTSTGRNFYNIVNPDISIISVGKNNYYNHPHKEVLDIIKNSKLYRTDQNGSIILKISNNELKICTQ